MCLLYPDNEVAHANKNNEITYTVMITILQHYFYSISSSKKKIAKNATIMQLNKIHGHTYIFLL